MSSAGNFNGAPLHKQMELPIGGWKASDLLAAREFLDMTQAELAAMIGYDRSSIAKIEGGDTPPRRVVELAVRYLVQNRPQGNQFQFSDPQNSRFCAVGTAIGINEPGFPGGETVEVKLVAGPAIWLRLLPQFDTGRRWSSIELKKVATQNGFPLVQLIDGYSNLGFVRNSEGFGVFGMMGDRSSTPAVSFVFETGEIWSVDTYIVSAVKDHAKRLSQHEIGIPYFEDRFKYALHSFRQILTRLGLGPRFRWIAGVEGIKDCGVFYPARAGQYFPLPNPHGRSLVDKVWETGLLDEGEEPKSALKPFFKKMFDTYNVERPEYLDELSNPK
jgi:DNA-binding XRE family transcriptional regulator